MYGKGVCVLYNSKKSETDNIRLNYDSSRIKCYMMPSNIAKMHLWICKYICGLSVEESGLKATYEPELDTNITRK